MDSSVLEVNVPVEVINTERMDITVQDMTAGDVSPHVSWVEEGRVKEEAAQDEDGCPDAAVTPSETATQLAWCSAASWFPPGSGTTWQELETTSPGRS